MWLNKWLNSLEHTPTSTTSPSADHHRMLWLQGWAKCLFCDLERRGCNHRSPTLIAVLNESFLSFLLDFAAIPTIVPILVEEFQMLGRSICNWASTFPPNWGVLLRFLPHSLWFLQTVVTGCNLLAARYVDRCEGGRPYWSQLPGLANHYTPGQA